MSEINYQALREAAERATPAMERLLMLPVDDDLLSEQELKDYGVDIDALNAFKFLAGPETVLALLDEREADKKRIAELEAEPVSQTCKLNEPSGNSPVTPDDWISCSERMPRGYADVLVTDGEHVEVKWWDESGYWNSWTELNSDIFADEITHWMPLPEPPL